MATYVTLVNDLLKRMNEVTVDTAGDGFDSVRNVQALAKDAINNSIRLILQDGQEWPFLKVTYTETLVAGTREYSLPADASGVDWETFYLKKTTGIDNTPKPLKALTFTDYTQRYRVSDDSGDSTGISAPAYVYQTYEQKFGVSPIPDNAYEVEYVYFSYPEDLVAYNDVCIIPDRFKHVIIDGGMMFMMRFRSNEQSAAIHQQNFENGIKAMRRVLLDDNMYLRSTFISRNQYNSFSNGV